MAATGAEVIRQMVERTNAHDLEGIFAELVEQGGADINDALEAESGHRPQLED